MKKGLALFLLLFVIAVTDSRSGAQEGRMTPVAVLENNNYQAGNIVEGVIITKDFIVKNTGSADLVIEHIKAG
jgi:hypothetical protein